MFRPCLECKETEGIKVDSREGTIVCTICGRVQELRLLEDREESISISKDYSSKGGDFASRIGAPSNPLLSDGGLHTQISGERCSLQKWATRSTQSSADRSLSRGFESIESLLGAMGLNEEVGLEAKKVFKFLSDHNRIKGRSHESVVAACLFMACRAKQYPRSLNEIAKVSAVDSRDLKKSLMHVSKYYKPNDVAEQSVFKLATRLALKLGLNRELQLAVAHYTSQAVKLGIAAGRNPMTIASAAAFIVGRKENSTLTSLNNISRTADVTEDTIRKCIKILCDQHHSLFADSSVNRNL